MIEFSVVVDKDNNSFVYKGNVNTIKAISILFEALSQDSPEKLERVAKVIKKSNWEQLSCLLWVLGTLEEEEDEVNTTH